MAAHKYLALAITALVAMSAAFHLVAAADEDPLQDIAVAKPFDGLNINGLTAKSAAETVADDFKTSILAKAGNTSNRFKATVTPASVVQFAGLNTLGISGVRIDFAVGGLNPPHVHPRATEILFLISGGPLEVGFVTTNAANTLFSTTLNAGDTFVFPKGLVHFQKNRGKTPAFAIAALSSQNPGVQQAHNSLFSANPNPIPSDILEQTFNVDAKIIKTLIHANVAN